MFFGHIFMQARVSYGVVIARATQEVRVSYLDSSRAST